jgi:hypothetical protein
LGFTVATQRAVSGAVLKRSVRKKLMTDSDHKKFIDLPPNQWRSEREKPREPFFGCSLWLWLKIIMWTTLLFTALHLLRDY